MTIIQALLINIRPDALYKLGSRGLLQDIFGGTTDLFRRVDDAGTGLFKEGMKEVTRGANILQNLFTHIGSKSAEGWKIRNCLDSACTICILESLRGNILERIRQLPFGVTPDQCRIWRFPDLPRSKGTVREIDRLLKKIMEGTKWAMNKISGDVKPKSKPKSRPKSRPRQPNPVSLACGYPDTLRNSTNVAICRHFHDLFL